MTNRGITEETVLKSSGAKRTDPIMSELRIILIGDNSSEISRVGNFILGRNAFNAEPPPPSVNQQSERAGGMVEGRYITLIKSPHQLNPKDTLDEITKQVKECLYLCAPGPHMFLLVLQSRTLKKDQDKIKTKLDSYSPWFMKYTIVLTPDEGVNDHAAAKAQGGINPSSQVVIGKSEGNRKVEVLKLLEKIEQVVRSNGGGYLTYDTNELLKEDKKKNLSFNRGDFKRVSKQVKHGLRMVLLGKNNSEISRVGNVFLGRDAFNTEPPPPSVEQHSERAGGTVDGRYITLINTPHLFDSQLTVDELNQRVRECMTLCFPGPHVFLLVLQSDGCTVKDWGLIKSIFNLFSDTALKHTTVITQNQGSGTDPHKLNQLIQEIKKYGGQHYQFDTVIVRSDLVKAVDKMLQKNNKGYVKSREMEESFYEKKQKKSFKRLQKEMSAGPVSLTPSTAPETKAWTKRLNLVLWGSNRVLKSSISDLIIGQRELTPESSSVCVKMEAEVCGRLITLVELPALYNSQLSEEEMMQEALRCVSLCDPGVHAFFLILPEGHLTDEDKGEVENIQMIFGPKFNDHTIVLTTQHPQNNPLDDALRTVIEDFGERQLYFNYSSKVQELIEQVEELLSKNRGNCYTTAMYYSAQSDNHLKYKREVNELKRKMSKLITKDFPRAIRIILLGRTAAGKSATGNTILGQEDVFKESVLGKTVTSACQKETAKINGRQITVIDTPGLFDPDSLTDYAINEITKSIAMVAPGPHVFMLVVSIEQYNQETIKATNMILNVLGEDSRTYTMVLFTRGDDLRDNSIEQFIENSGQDTKDLIKRCEDRYHVFNNRNHKDQTQVTALLEKIDYMVAVNKGSCYTNEMLQQVERKKQVEEKLQEREEKEQEEEPMMMNVKEQIEQQRLWYQQSKKRNMKQDDAENIKHENEELEITMENIEKQKHQQWLWYQRHILKHDVRQEEDGASEGTANNPHQV